MFRRTLLRIRDFEVLDDEIRIGERSFAVADVTSVRVERDGQSGALGYQLASAGYLVVAILVLVPIMGGHISSKFLFIVAIAAGVGLSLLQDLANMPGKLMFRIWLTAGGRQHLIFFAQGETEVTAILSVVLPLTGANVEWSEVIQPVPVVPPLGQRADANRLS